MACSTCGQVEHAGGCDLVEFYHFQRWARPMERTPAPPSPGIMAEAPRVDEAPPTLSANEFLDTCSPITSADWVQMAKQAAIRDEHGNVQFTPLASATNDPKPESVKVKVSRPKQGKIMTTGKAKPVDSPEVAAKREAIRLKRVERMAYVRSLRKKKSV